jgi:hypothetical protein
MPKITKFRKLDKIITDYKDGDEEHKIIDLVQKKDGSYQLKLIVMVDYYICDCCDCAFNLTPIRNKYLNELKYADVTRYNIKLGNVPEFLAYYIFANITNQGFCIQSFGQIEFAKIEADYSKYIEYVNNCKKVFLEYDRKLPDEILYTIADFL